MRPMREQDVDSYVKTLYSDEDAVPEPCTAKATMYTSMLIGAYITKVIKDFLCGDPYPRITQWNIKDHAFQVFTTDSPEEAPEQ